MLKHLFCKHKKIHDIIENFDDEIFLKYKNPQLDLIKTYFIIIL